MKRIFPTPVQLTPGCSRWRLSEIEVYETGKTKRTPANEVYLRDTDLGERYHVHRNSIWRWARMGAEATA